MSARDVIAKALEDTGLRDLSARQSITDYVTNSLESHGYRIVTVDLLVEHGLVTADLMEPKHDRRYGDTNVVQNHLCPECLCVTPIHAPYCKRRLVS